jgi:hypothetical protein
MEENRVIEEMNKRKEWGNEEEGEEMLLTC